MTELLDTLRGEARQIMIKRVTDITSLVWFMPGGVFFPLQSSAKFAEECQGLARVPTGNVQY
ncbi:hypothetical protein FIBSPDRAFT_870385 [Athelia psychrophila]|uniref:Uncharacterized protein n=1 Tax=Athelia psychrophila TaxID=1759441 RepID=A0A166B6J6_9AGAM|nr:hypothetical protein FIBSPDRAFT_870385 [Fibularhizoctonia sp. CBS 109695]